MNSIPTESDWRSEPWDLDVQWAYKNLFGKTHDETVQLFRDNALIYYEDVMYMPFACFPYYVNAYIDYLHSDDAQGDSAASSCFLNIVENRIDEIRSSDAVLITGISNTIKHLIQRQRWFDTDSEPYRGDERRAALLLSNLDVNCSGENGG